MYKNAGIKSKKEAAQRLIDGEVFYSSLLNQRIYFDDSNRNPFRYADERMKDCWDEFSEWKVEVNWHDDIGDGVLCWVWDRGDKRIALVVKMNSCDGFKFMTANGSWWLNAKPLTKEEALKYIKE